MAIDVNTLKNNLTNPQRTYLWDILIPSPIGGGDSDTLSVRAQSVQKPSREVGAIHVPWRQSAGLNFPGKLAYTHQWECTFIEGEDHKIHDAIYGWMQTIVDDYDNIGAGDDQIKSDIYLNLLGVNGAVTLKIRLIGCYVQRLGEISFSNDTEAIASYSVLFSFDSWEIVA